MRRRGFSVFFLLITALSPLLGQDGDSPVTSPIWREALEGMVTGLPSVEGETVVTVLDGGNLKAYSRRGTFLWDYFAGGKLAPYITRSREGLNYICRTNGTFIVLNRVGRELWRMNLDAPLSAPVLVGWDGRLFIPLGDWLICYTAAGYPLWGKTLPAPIALGPLADTRGGLMTVLENGEFLSIDPFGKTRSRLLPAVPAAITPLGGGGGTENQDVLIFYEAGTVDILSRDAGGNQTLLSGSFPSLPAPPLAAVSRGDMAALTLADGRVLFLSGSEGRILWTAESHLRAGGAPVAPKQEVSMIFDEWGIYVLSRSGASGFTEDGRRLWTLELTGAAALPALSGEGTLYAGGEDWILYAYQMEDRTGPPRGSSSALPKGGYGLGVPPPLSWRDYSFGLGEIDPHLDRIRRDIFTGRVGENERDYAAYLMEISGSFIRTPGASAVRPPVHIRHRIAGAQLLGYIGSRETIPFLVTLLYYEQETLVKIAAVEAIGRIGLDPDGVALKVFSAMLIPPRPGGDERILTAIAGATGALCRFSGPPLSNTGVKILAALTARVYPPLVRDRAQAELNSLLPPP
ncbi:MAG: hypothetical protein LBG08_02360 [Spirochaetaceae bacterium]|nr:hypothetical protein [Spirochaetaceae bacterium]